MKIIAIILTFLSISFNTNAKIANITWEEFIAHSDLIAVVSINELKRIDEANGVSKVKVIQLIKGNIDYKEIDINWSIGTISKPLFNIYYDHIVFLRKDLDGKYQPSIIGRSFWKLEKTILLNKNLWI
ncbi:hypothetical protein ACOBV9_08675 [Pseudoalteromonas espejiana]